MSTVIWYEGKLYADTQVTHTELVFKNKLLVDEFTEIREGHKIFQENGKLYGVTGTLAGWDEFKKNGYKGKWYWYWSREDCYLGACIIEWDGEKIITWEFRQKKILNIYICWHEKTTIIPVKDQYFYMGSGAEYAHSAIKSGFTIPDAIELASWLDPGTNDTIEIKSLPTVELN